MFFSSIPNLYDVYDNNDEVVSILLNKWSIFGLFLIRSNYPSLGSGPVSLFVGVRLISNSEILILDFLAYFPF